MNPPISSNFYSICQGTHPAKTNLCRNSPTKGARNIGSAQAQELIGSNDLVTCLEAKHEKSQTIEILILSESFRLWSGCRKKKTHWRNSKPLKTRTTHRSCPHFAISNGKITLYFAHWKKTWWYCWTLKFCRVFVPSSCVQLTSTRINSYSCAGVALLCSSHPLTNHTPSKQIFWPPRRRTETSPMQPWPPLKSFGKLLAGMICLWHSTKLIKLVGAR